MLSGALCVENISPLFSDWMNEELHVKDILSVAEKKMESVR